MNLFISRSCSPALSPSSSTDALCLQHVGRIGNTLTFKWDVPPPPVAATPPKCRDQFRSIQNFALRSPDADLSPASKTAHYMTQATKMATLCSQLVGSKHPDLKPQDDDVTAFGLTPLHKESYVFHRDVGCELLYGRNQNGDRALVGDVYINDNRLHLHFFPATTPLTKVGSFAPVRVAD